MLSPLEIALFAAVGLVFAAGLIVVARWGGRNLAPLAGYALLAACFIYVGLSLGSENPNSWSAVEMTAVAVFGSLIFLSRLTSPWVLVAALLLHPAWLIYVHYIGTGALFTPAPLVLANVGFDIALALYLAILALRGGPAPPRLASPSARAEREARDERAFRLRAASRLERSGDRRDPRFSAARSRRARQRDASAILRRP